MEKAIATLIISIAQIVLCSIKESKKGSAKGYDKSIDVLDSALYEVAKKEN